MNYMRANEDCNICKIAGVVKVTEGICNSFDLDCEGIEKAIKEDKKPEEFIDVIKDIKENNKGKADEQLDEVIKIINEQIETESPAGESKKK